MCAGLCVQPNVHFSQFTLGVASKRAPMAHPLVPAAQKPTSLDGDIHDNNVGGDSRTSQDARRRIAWNRKYQEGVQCHGHC